MCVMKYSIGELMKWFLGDHSSELGMKGFENLN